MTIRTIDGGYAQTLDTIIAQCKKVVEEVLALAKAKNDDGWDASPSYYKKRGFIDASTYDCFKTIDSICETFSTKQKKRGFLSEGGAHALPGKLELFWPKQNSEIWKNVFNDGLTELHEEHATDKAKTAAYLANAIAKDATRLTFYKFKDALGNNMYKYIGDFKLDIAESRKQNVLVWKRIATKHVI